MSALGFYQPARKQKKGCIATEPVLSLADYLS